MMALKLQDLRDKHGHVNRSASTSLQKRLVNSWPAVSGGKKGKAAAASNKAGIQSASSVQVGDMSVNVADGEDARLQLRHELVPAAGLEPRTSRPGPRQVCYSRV